jgi:anti-sigma factor RsiW
MSDEQRMSTEACGVNAAAYVLGALEEHEAAAFAGHLESCAVCRDEVAAFRQVADALPMAAPAHRASPALRERVLGQVRAEPKRAPTAGGPLAPHESMTPPPVTGRVQPRGAPRSRYLPRWWARALDRRPALTGSLAGSLAGLLVAAIVIAAVLVVRSNNRSATRVYASTVGDARLYVTSGHGELVVARLQQPTSGRIYEVWLQRRGQAPAPTAALFSVTRSGTGDAAVPGDLSGVSAVLVTQEPAGGSLRPTSRPVVVTPLG